MPARSAAAKLRPPVFALVPAAVRLDRQHGRRRELAHSVEDGPGRRHHRVPAEVMVQRHRVDRRIDAAAGEQRGQRRGEAQAVRAVSEVERLDPEAIAAEQGAAAAGVYEAEREHPDEPGDEAVAPAVPRLQQDLGVARREEAVAVAGQLLTQLGVVVDAAVEHGDETELRVDHRLRAAGREVDHGQAPVGECGAPAGPGACAVRPAPGDLAAHAEHGLEVRRPALCELAGEAAHAQASLLLAIAEAGFARLPASRKESASDSTSPGRPRSSAAAR